MNETPMSEVPGHTFEAPDHCAWTDPTLCKDPHEKGSMYCGPHQLAARKQIMRNVLERFFTLVADPTAESDYVSPRLEAALALIDLVAESTQPEELVAAAELGVREMEARAHPQLINLAAAPELPAPVGFIVAGPSTPERLHEDGSRKIEVDWDEVVFQRLGAAAAKELRACRAAGYEDWQLHALVPVPDEVAFEAELGPRGVGCFSPAEDAEDGRPSTVPPYAEQVLGIQRAVIGWVWPVDASPDSDWRCVTKYPGMTGSAQFGQLGNNQPRDRAIGWVLQQAHNRGEADRG